MDPVPGERLETFRRAIGAHNVVELDYRDGRGAASRRRVRPLGIFFWGDTWSVAAWCELRQDFRNFRLDRIAGLRRLEERFPDESGKRLEDFLRRMEAR